MREKSIRVLLIDDDSVDAELTERALHSVSHPRFDVEWVASLSEAEKRLHSGNFDVALLDLSLPDSSHEETLQRFRAECSAELPVIVLTGLENDEGAQKSLELGAQDYLVKDDVNSDLLSRSIRYAMQRHHLLNQLKTANSLLEQKNDRLAELYDTAQQFVENVSHEFRTPLTVIREFTSIIRDGLDGPVSPEQVEHLEKVLHRTDDLALMVDDMLDISKLEAGLLGVWRRPCQVGELVETVRSLLQGRADSKKVRLSARVDSGVPTVLCDEEKARRVLINLAVNAIKFTPEGGSVEIWATAKRDAGEVSIGITDSGPGISPDNLAIIFERFKQVEQGLQASTKGFGLGLNIAKELVGLNLGRIDVESRAGAGSTFSFTLPRFEPQSLFERYLDRLSTLPNVSATVSVLTVTLDAEQFPEAVPVADEFLQRSVRTNDLVVSYRPGTWVIAAVCPVQHCGRLIDRLAHEWASLTRNFANATLPALQIVYHQSNAAVRESDALLRKYLSLATQGGSALPRPRRVLVVDDDHEVSQCLGLRLQAAGYDVLTAADGEEGVSAALQHHPDAVVLDVRMPKKDGLTVLSELRGDPSTRRTPIVMLSASVRDQRMALEAGANYFVPKPYDATDVLSAIEASLREEFER